MRMIIRQRHLWCLLLLLAGCKAATVSSSTAKYSEDLTQYRKPMAANNPDTAITVPNTNDAVVLKGHIGPGLDSVLIMIADRNAANDSWDGYTIQMYSGLSREEAYEARDQAEDLGLDLEPAIEYYQPNYRVKGGKFFDRLEAYRTYKEVKKSFPQALLLPSKMPLLVDEDN